MAAPKNIDEALLELQKNPPRLVKDRDGQVGSQKTKYADLAQAYEVILPRLAELGVLWKTSPTVRVIEGASTPMFVIDWALKHLESGTEETGAYPLPNGVEPQKYGSAITYAQRYALIAVTRTIAEREDDDGDGYRGRQGMAQRATARQQPRQEPTAQRAQPAPRAERARPAEQPPLPERPTSGPPASPAGVAGQVKPATKPMLTKLAVQFGPGELGKHVEGGEIARPTRLKMAGSLIGRQIASFTDLSFDEAKRLMDVVGDALQRRDPISYLRAVAQGQTPGPDAPTEGVSDAPPAE